MHLGPRSSPSSSDLDVDPACGLLGAPENPHAKASRGACVPFEAESLGRSLDLARQNQNAGTTPPSRPVWAQPHELNRHAHGTW
eukprot:scaffold5254_cov52-Phaeocystis_antarctica.AAC.4